MFFFQTIKTNVSTSQYSVRLTFFLGHVRFSTLPSKNPRLPCLARISVRFWTRDELGESRAISQYFVRLTFFLGHVRFSTLPSKNPRLPCLARISARFKAWQGLVETLSFWSVSDRIPQHYAKAKADSITAPTACSRMTEIGL